MLLVFKEENKDIFDAIVDGRKNIETRAMDSRYDDIFQTKSISFTCGKETCERRVKAVTLFASIEELLKVYTPEEINPKLHTTEEITSMYMSFPDCKERIAKGGIFAVELERI